MISGFAPIEVAKVSLAPITTDPTWSSPNPVVQTTPAVAIDGHGGWDAALAGARTLASKGSNFGAQQSDYGVFNTGDGYLTARLGVTDDGGMHPLDIDEVGVQQRFTVDGWHSGIGTLSAISSATHYLDFRSSSAGELKTYAPQ